MQLLVWVFLANGKYVEEMKRKKVLVFFVTNLIGYVDFRCLLYFSESEGDL